MGEPRGMIGREVRMRKGSQAVVTQLDDSHLIAKQ
jgi:hypothetical protein